MLMVPLDHSILIIGIISIVTINVIMLGGEKGKRKEGKILKFPNCHNRWAAPAGRGLPVIPADLTALHRRVAPAGRGPPVIPAGLYCLNRRVAPAGRSPPVIPAGFARVKTRTGPYRPCSVCPFPKLLFSFLLSSLGDLGGLLDASTRGSTHQLGGLEKSQLSLLQVSFFFFLFLRISI